MTRVLGAAVLALASAACWFGWLAWDRTYRVDPATGVASGPYEAWQVMGCGMSLLVLVVLATGRLPWWTVVPVVPVAFAAAWSLTASTYDTSGLWPVGALVVLVGTLLATALVAGVTAAVRRRARVRVSP